MLVDPRKTKLTIINGERSDLAVTAFEKNPVGASTAFNVVALASLDSCDSSEMAAEISGTSVSFILVEEYIEFD